MPVSNTVSAVQRSAPHPPLEDEEAAEVAALEPAEDAVLLAEVAAPEEDDDVRPDVVLPELVDAAKDAEPEEEPLPPVDDDEDDVVSSSGSEPLHATTSAHRTAGEMSSRRADMDSPDGFVVRDVQVRARRMQSRGQSQLGNGFFTSIAGSGYRTTR